MLWIDAQMSPAIAASVSVNFSVSAVALRDLGLRDATDREIFFAAREASAILITKDSDFLRLLDELGSPPKSFGSPAATLPTRGSKKFWLPLCRRLCRFYNQSNWLKLVLIESVRVIVSGTVSEIVPQIREVVEGGSK
jgi:predicted nuclease of predicted toxin-antitoxin system